MSIPETLAKLTAPPNSDARIVILPSMGQIRILPYRIWWLFYLLGTYVIAFMLLFCWFKPINPDPYLSDPAVSLMRYRLTIVFATLLGVGAIAFFVFWFLSIGRESIFFSKEYLTIQSHNLVRIPVEAITGVRNVIGKNETHFDASEGLFNSRVVSKSPRGSVDVITSDGPVRLMSNWKHGTTRWLAGAIATVIDKPLVAEWNEQEHAHEVSKPIKPVMFTGWELSLVGLPVAVAATLLMVSTGRVIYFGSASEHWPKTEGTVLSHRYEAGYAWMDKKVDAEVNYTYRVDSNTFHNDRVWYGFHMKTYPIEVLFTRLNDNDSVTIHYDPDLPSRSTLITGYDTGLRFVLAILTVFLLLGLGLLAYRPNRERVAFTRKYFPKRHKFHVWAPIS